MWLENYSHNNCAYQMEKTFDICASDKRIISRIHKEHKKLKFYLINQSSELID